MLLTIQQMQERLSHMTYRPGWKMSVYEGATEGAHISIEATIDDSFKPGEQFYFHVVSAIPPYQRIEDFDLFVSWRLRRIEIHESMEWLKVDGKPLYDPHRAFGDRDLIIN